MTVRAPLSTTTWPQALRGIDRGDDPRVIVIDEVAVGAGLHAACRPQARELASVRRQHDGASDPLPPAVLRGERPERLRIDDGRRGIGVAGHREDPADEVSGRERSPKAGPDDEGVVVVVEDHRESGLRVDLLEVVLRERHRRRLDDLRGEQRLK